MKPTFKISILILFCFALMGCPAGHFHDYEYVGNELNEDNIKSIKVGYYYQFIDKKENGLSAIVETNPKFDGNVDELIKEVKSSTFGKLTRTKYLYKAPENIESKNTIIYNLVFDHRNERKTLKKIKNDTISIEFMNGKKSIFVRKAE